jgi:hypothetical protein
MTKIVLSLVLLSLSFGSLARAKSDTSAASFPSSLNANTDPNGEDSSQDENGIGDYVGGVHHDYGVKQKPWFP